MSVGAKLSVGALVVAGVTGYVAYLGASSSWQYYVTTDECALRAEQLVGLRVRVSGRVVPGSLSVATDRRSAEFVLGGSSGKLRTVCAGPLPDNLAEDRDVVVEGRLARTDRLDGDKVLTRCASKYQSR